MEGTPGKRRGRSSRGKVQQADNINLPTTSEGTAPSTANNGDNAAASTSGTGVKKPASTSSNVATGSTAAFPPLGRGKNRPRGAGELTSQLQGLQIASERDGNGGGRSNESVEEERAIGRYSARGGPVDPPQLKEGKPSDDNVRSRSENSPKKGTSGKPVVIEANAFALQTLPTFVVYKYHLDFSPDEDRTSVRKSLVAVHRNIFGGHSCDGATVFSVKSNICPQGKPLELFSERRNDNARIRITVKPVGVVAPGNFEYKQLMNVIMNKVLNSLNFLRMRRRFLDPEAKIVLAQYNLTLWPGYIMTIHEGENCFYLQADLTMKTVRNDTAYSVFRRSVEKSERQRSNFKDEFKNDILGAVVVTLYNNINYRITDVDYDLSPMSQFPQRERKGVPQQMITYQQYFLQKYGEKIRDLKQPMLISRCNARQRRSGMAEYVHLVPELCLMTGLAAEMRSNFQLMRDVATHTRVEPSDRVRRLLELNERIRNRPETLNEWDMSLSPQLMKVNGRELQQEKITVGGQKYFLSGPDCDWTKEMFKHKMILAPKLQNWILVFPANSASAANDLNRLMVQIGAAMSFEIASPKMITINGVQTAMYIEGLKNGINQYNPQLVVCLVPNTDERRYSSIKRLCIVDRAVSSQVVQLKHFQGKKSVQSVVTKIVIQICTKIGGIPWSLDIPMKGLMIVGFDVCHARTAEGRSSWGAMVSTLDSTYGRYFSTINRHASGEELSNNIGLTMAMAVQKYSVQNHALPSTIIIYRDGVGEGDQHYVKEIEVANIKKNLEKIYIAANQKLKIAFVVVTKRINTRLFANGRNPNPGTIVDDEITNPLQYDFFLVSQSVRQGTVSPTHYHVLDDNTGLKPDHIQRLSYKLTHMYFNWTGTIRVPAPCQYAHKLAFLTSQSIGQAHGNLNNLLYFL